MTHISGKKNREKQCRLNQNVRAASSTLRENLKKTVTCADRRAGMLIKKQVNSHLHIFTSRPPRWHSG